jgi:hypothetical protein
MPHRLRKFIEMFAGGGRTGRIAYVHGKPSLPKPVTGAEWAEDKRFKAADEVLAEPKLKAVFKTALEAGIAVKTEK